MFNSILSTVFVPFTLLRLSLSAWELDVTCSAAGVGGLLGSLVSTQAGLRWGAGQTVITCRALMPLAWAVIAVVPDQASAHSHVLAVLLVGSGQFLYCLAIGVENANEMGYRQAVTPDELALPACLSR